MRQKKAKEEQHPEGVERELTVVNSLGIHARPAALIVKTASLFEANVFFEKEGMRVSAKSIMGVLTLEGFQGTVFKAVAEGADADSALQALAELFKARFHEE